MLKNKLTKIAAATLAAAALAGGVAVADAPAASALPAVSVMEFYFDCLDAGGFLGNDGNLYCELDGYRIWY